MPAPKFNDPEVVARICKLYEEGERLVTICRVTGKNEQTVKRILKEAGLYVSSVGAAKEPGSMTALERELACNDLLADLREHHPDGPPTYFVKRESLPARYVAAPPVAGLSTSPAALCAE